MAIQSDLDKWPCSHQSVFVSNEDYHFYRRWFGKHFTETNGHERSLVANATFSLPHHRGGLRDKNSTRILQELKKQLPGSGFT